MKDKETLIQVVGFFIGVASTILILMATVVGFSNLLDFHPVISFLIVAFCYFGPFFAFTMIPLAIFAVVSLIKVFGWHWLIAILAVFPLFVFALIGDILLFYRRQDF